MKVRPAYLNIIRYSLAAAVLSCTLHSCDNAIYDYEGDCSVTYTMSFRYDRNMKWADAFPQEVKSVHLYAFGNDGTLVWQRSESGEALASDGYAMKLDLPAGQYRMVAWCGLENDGERDETFSVPEARVGETRLEDLQCRMAREYDSEGAYSGGKLYPLFHGMCDVDLPASDDYGDYRYTMDLVKDTNHVRVILQQLSGEPVNENDFTFRIEEENGLMGYDNDLLADEMITYRPYHIGSGTAGMGIDDYSEPGRRAMPWRHDTRAITSVSVAIADLSVARLVEGRKTYLTIDTKQGERVARIPLTDFALLLKDGYDRYMTDQDYLDRQDEYSLTFFLDKSQKWIGTSIIINSWKVVLNDVDF